MPPKTLLSRKLVKEQHAAHGVSPARISVDPSRPEASWRDRSDRLEGSFSVHHGLEKPASSSAPSSPSPDTYTAGHYLCGPISHHCGPTATPREAMCAPTKLQEGRVLHQRPTPNLHPPYLHMRKPEQQRGRNMGVGSGGPARGQKNIGPYIEFTPQTNKTPNLFIHQILLNWKANRILNRQPTCCRVRPLSWLRQRISLPLLLLLVEHAPRTIFYTDTAPCPPDHLPLPTPSVPPAPPPVV